MRNIITILAFLVCMAVFGQASSRYQRLGKLTTSEINAIDVTNSNYVYTAYDTTLGIEVINTGSGWEPRSTTITLDETPTPASTNGVESGGVYTALAGKQATLVSGTNIKTINSNSLLGSGNINTNQTLSVSGNDLSISSGNTIAVPNVSNSNMIAGPSSGIQVGTAAGSQSFYFRTLNSTLMRFDGDQSGGGNIYLYDKYNKTGHGNGTYVDLLNELGAKANSADITDTDDQTAAEVASTPSGDLTSTNVQAALEELNSKKASLSGTNVWSQANTFNVNPRIETYISLKEDGGMGSVTGHGSISHLSNNGFRFFGNNQTAGNVFDFPDSMTVERTYTFPDASGGVLISDTSEITGSDQITNLISATSSELTADPPGATTVALCEDCGPAASFTGTVIPLDGYYQMDDRTVDTPAWTLGTDVRDGSSVEILVNIASEPTITGDSPIPNTQAFVADKLMVLTIKVIEGHISSFWTKLEE